MCPLPVVVAFIVRVNTKSLVLAFGVVYFIYYSNPFRSNPLPHLISVCVLASHPRHSHSQKIVLGKIQNTRRTKKKNYFDFFFCKEKARVVDFPM
jgi:hypothetical protein